MAYPQSLGRYRLLKRIARGGMGEVWSAEALDGGGPQVAVKTLLSPEDADTMSLAKFIGEARIGAAVSDHPNIVKTIDLGLEGERIFLVMELLDGRPLSHLSRGVQLPAEGVVGIALPVLSALEHAQSAPGPNGEPMHLVHRDLKPGNLFITRAGVVKVIDFGIALASGLDQTTTRTGLIRGSIAYVSPEQARGERTDGRSDVYSLAVVLHELLIGRRLFDQQSDAARLSAILFGEVPDVRSVRPEVPAKLNEAIMHALQREAANRPADARAFAEELRAAIAPAAPWGPPELAKWADSRPLVQPKPSATGPIIASDASPKSGLPPMRVMPVVAPAAPVPSPGITERDLAPVDSRASRLAPMLMVLGGVALLSGIGVYALMTAPDAPVPVPVVKVAKPPEPEPVKPVEPPTPEPVVAAVAQPAPVAPAAKPVRVAKPRPFEVASAATVHVTVDSRPSWATVTVDGKELGPTPLVRVPLPVSSRLLTAVNADGKKKTVKLELVEGRDEKVLLEW